jgi:TusA-related sulfurtransferase
VGSVDAEYESTAIERNHPTASWLLEGGDDLWPDLRTTLTRCLDEMATGGVLELISWVPGIDADIGAWCRETGHGLLHVLQEGGNTRHWIKKGEAIQKCNSVQPDTTA